MKTTFIRWACMLVCLLTCMACEEETVVNETRLVLSTRTLDFGEDCSALSFDVINRGDAPFNWDANGMEDENWFELYPTNGTLDAGEDMTVQVRLLRDNITEHREAVVFINADDKSVALKMKADEQPVRYLEFSTDELVLGTEDSISFSMTSHHGETAYELTTAGQTGWVKLSKTSGVIPEFKAEDNKESEVITVTVDRSGLAPGKYEFTLIVQSDLGVTLIPARMTVEDSRVGIYSLQDLIDFRDARNSGAHVSRWKDENGVIKLHTDIDLRGIDWTPIKKVEENETFDGGGHTIKMEKFHIGADEIQWGFFLGNEGVIKDLRIEILLQTNKYNNIGVVSYGNRGKIIRCFTTILEGSEFKEETWFGGVVNSNYGTIESCVSNGILQIHGVSGGICCRNYGFIQMCTNKLEMNGVGTDTGGITGYNEVVTRFKRSGEIFDCVNNGPIRLTKGSYRGLGGIAGLMNNGEIHSCVNNGSLYAEDSRNTVGGIVGCATVVIVGSTEQGRRRIYNCSNNGDINSDVAYAVGCIVGDLAGADSRLHHNSHAGHINNELASEYNAIGLDLRGVN